MLTLFLLIAALVAGAAAAGITWRAGRRGRPAGDMTARPAGAAIARRPAARSLLARRLDPEVATGLALTLALVLIVGGGVLLAVLAYLVRGDTGLVRIDRSVALWGDRHETPFSDDVLDAVTTLGEPTVVAILAVVLAGVETARTRSRWVVPFVLVVVAGNGILTTTVKHLADRVRPDVNPIADTLGPSFPSGHSSWSIAFFTAAALLLSRGRSRTARTLIAGVAAALTVTVAGSRVLLGVHWLSDVLAGLALGAAWFAVCAIAFGGRLLRFGAPAEEAVHPTAPRPTLARRAP
jgi:membrane-associated phospholipid phosphatase